MKKKIKPLLVVIGLASFAYTTISLFTGFTTTVDEHILVEIYEVPQYEDKGIHIHYGDNKTEIVPFHDFKKENHSLNGEIIISTINRLEREGYDLTHIGSGLAMNGMITKIFMVKRK